LLREKEMKRLLGDLGRGKLEFRRGRPLVPIFATCEGIIPGID